MKIFSYILMVAILLILLSFSRIWPHTNMFGTERINSFEFFGGCWQGDVRMCDYDLFD